MCEKELGGKFRRGFIELGRLVDAFVNLGCNLDAATVT